jgi:methyltransferase (TIGR00027 family)
VDGAKRSRTAQAVLAERTLLTDMGVLSDPFARTMLSPSWTVFVGVLKHLPAPVRPWSLARAGLAARVLWFDAQVAAALDAGTTQIAVIGAGYDSRAWRFRRDGVQFFELDHAATQQDKVRRAPGPGPKYVEADLMIQSAAEALLADGLDPSGPALFVLEGLTMYLPEEVVRSQLDGLARSSAVGSRIAADFAPPRDAGTSRDRRLMRVQRLARAGSGEKFDLLVDRPQAVDLFEASGWHVTEAMTLREAARALVPRASGLPIEAINEHKTLVAGVRSRRDSRE